MRQPRLTHLAPLHGQAVLRPVSAYHRAGLAQVVMHFVHPFKVLLAVGMPHEDAAVGAAAAAAMIVTSADVTGQVLVHDLHGARAAGVQRMGEQFANCHGPVPAAPAREPVCYRGRLGGGPHSEERTHQVLREMSADFSDEALHLGGLGHVQLHGPALAGAMVAGPHCRPAGPFDGGVAGERDVPVAAGPYARAETVTAADIIHIRDPGPAAHQANERARPRMRVEVHVLAELVEGALHVARDVVQEHGVSRLVDPMRVLRFLGGTIYIYIYIYIYT